MRKIFLLMMGSFVLGSFIYAQDISGTIKDQQGKGIDKTTVSLLHAKDSSLAKLAVTKDNGQFSFIQVKPGSYVLSVSHIGFVSSFSKLFEVAGSGQVKLADMELVKVSTELKEVVVTAQKPMVELRADKTILNVEGTINATGNDALELLRKSPGVMIDKDDNISLAGKNGVQVYIDGKPTPLSGSDLSSYLKSLQSAQIEAIEISGKNLAKFSRFLKI